jgi:hypothetical protein
LDSFDLNNFDTRKKQADLDENTARAVVQVGLLFNELPGCAEMPFA